MTLYDGFGLLQPVAKPQMCPCLGLPGCYIRLLPAENKDTMPLPFLILLWPLAEIATFIIMAEAIGGLNTFLLVIAGAIAGVSIMRRQGLANLMALRQSGTSGEMPMDTVLDGLAVTLAGLLLFIPGFLTDIVGLALLVPSIRQSIGAWLVQSFTRSGRRFHSTEATGNWTHQEAHYRRSGHGPDEETVIDVSYTEVRDDDADPGRPRLGPR